MAFPSVAEEGREGWERLTWAASNSYHWKMSRKLVEADPPLAWHVPVTEDMLLSERQFSQLVLISTFMMKQKCPSG